jgi:hypothetical protein
MGQQDILVATVCGGSLLLAMAGLLEGRHAVTNHLGMAALGATGAIPIHTRVVEDGPCLVSGGGVTSGLDVALYVVERELGPRIANAVEALFEYERRGTVWRAQGLEPAVFSEASLDEAASAWPIDLPVPHAEPLPYNVIDGNWQTTISTPIGKMPVLLCISSVGGIIQGTASQGDEVAPFLNPTWDGARLTWTQHVKKPMRLNLKFEVMIQGGRMHGTAKAGLLPSSKVEGVRIP